MNTILDSCSQGLALPRLNPLNDNVIFCSALHRWSFTLRSYARHYRETFGADLPVEAFARRLWGNVWYNYATRRFEGKPADSRSVRSFVQFCLEPLWALRGREHVDGRCTHRCWAARRPS